MIIPGLVSVTFRKRSQTEVVALASRAGLRAIEWGGDIHVPHGNLAAAREAQELTQGEGLRIAAYGSYYRVAQSEQDGLEFATVLETAIELGAPLIRVWAGAIASAQANDEYWKRVVEDSRRIAEVAARAGVQVGYEYHANTLTDTNESAQRLLRETHHPNLYTFWQPPNEKDTSDCLASLQAILPRLANVHVFHRWPTVKDQCPLADGRDRWIQFLDVIESAGGEHVASLEFVCDDSPESLQADAQALKAWLAHDGAERVNR